MPNTQELEPYYAITGAMPIEHQFQVKYGPGDFADREQLFFADPDENTWTLDSGEEIVFVLPEGGGERVPTIRNGDEYVPFDEWVKDRQVHVGSLAGHVALRLNPTEEQPRVPEVENTVTDAESVASVEYHSDPEIEKPAPAAEPAKPEIDQSVVDYYRKLEERKKPVTDAFGEFSDSLGEAIRDKVTSRKSIAEFLSDQEVLDALGNGLSFLGFNKAQSKDITSAWASETKEPQDNENPRLHRIKANVDTLIALASTNVGYPKRLHNEFGIRHFGRYGSEILESQLKYSGDQGHVEKQMLYISATEDWNGGISNPGGELTVSTARRQVLFYEAASVDELRQAALSYKGLVGRNAKDLVVAGHGNKSGVILGKGRYGRLDRTKRAFRRAGLTGKFSVDVLPEERMVYLSCKGGVEDGMGDVTATRTGREVHGSEITTDVHLKGDGTVHSPDKEDRKLDRTVVIKPDPENKKRVNRDYRVER